MSAGSGSVRLRLLIAYDGGAFRGWQSQADGQAVQDSLERAVASLWGERQVVHGAGRTDAGVHALGQVAHVDVPRERIPEKRWLPGLNAYLPAEVRVLKVRRVSPEFHARFGARGKRYTYRMCTGGVLPPLELGRMWHFPCTLDLSVLRQGAELLVGTHDFGAFAANRGKPGENTVRTVSKVAVRARGGILTLDFEGNGFLYRMVRLMTGTLIRCARGQAPVSWIGELLEGKGRIKTSFGAPAHGLYLRQVLY